MRKLLKAIRDAIDCTRDAIDFFRPMDFGEFGLLRDASGNLVPMTQAAMDDFKADVHERVEDFWFKQEAEAFQLYGEAILKPQ